MYQHIYLSIKERLDCSPSGSTAGDRRSGPAPACCRGRPRSYVQL